MRGKTLALCSTALMLAWAGPASAQSTDTPASDSQSGVPTSTQAAPTTDQASTPVTDEATGDDIVVTGLRRSLESAINLKRESPAIVDAIVAQDIGKLPDIAASDSLARVVGVQVERANGEAGNVLVRGLDQYPTTYNGRDIFTAEARRVAIQDFPAGGVASLEVFKSVTADQIEGGLAGLINVRSRRPFDFQGFQIAGEVRGDHTTQAQRIDPNGSLLISNRFDTGIGEMGALINFSYNRLHYRDSARFDGGFIATSNATNAPGQPAFRYPDAVGIFYGVGKRSRPSVNGAFQWRPSDQIEVTLDGIWQGFRRDRHDRFILVPLFGADARFSNVALREQPNAAGQREAQSLTVTNGVRPEFFQAATKDKTDTYQFGGNVTYTSDNWRISTDIARTDSDYELSVYSYDTALAFTPVADINFDVDREDGGVEFNLRNIDMSDPRNFVYRGFFDRALIARGDDLQLRSDVSYKPDPGGFITSIDFGARFTDRNGEFQDGDRYNFQEPLRISLANQPLQLHSIPPGFKGSDVQPIRTWVQPTYSGIRDNVEFLRTQANFPQGAPPFAPTRGFTANEKIAAGYAQVKYAFGSDIRFDGVLGLRVARTEITTNGVGTNRGVQQPFTDSNRFTDYLPTFQLRVRPTDNLQFRGSVSKTRTNPNFGDLNPALFIAPNVDVNGRRGVSGGNPDLDPFTSWNYDAIVEYYFGRTGAITLGAFRKDVKGFIQRIPQIFTDPTLGLIELNIPRNEQDIRLQGLEAQVTAFADFESLPQWARGFGVQANVTYIDQEVENAAAGGRDIPGISEFTYNLIGLYEQGPLSMRLAYNRRTEYDAAELGLFTEPVSRLDFSANVTPVENFTVTFNAANILGEPFRNQFRYRNGDTFVGQYPRDVRFEETVYSVGLRFRY